MGVGEFEGGKIDLAGGFGAAADGLRDFGDRTTEAFDRGYALQIDEEGNDAAADAIGEVLQRGGFSGASSAVEVEDGWLGGEDDFFDRAEEIETTFVAFFGADGFEGVSGEVRVEEFGGVFGFELEGALVVLEEPQPSIGDGSVEGGVFGEFASGEGSLEFLEGLNGFGEEFDFAGRTGACVDGVEAGDLVEKLMEDGSEVFCAARNRGETGGESGDVGEVAAGIEFVDGDLL